MLSGMIKKEFLQLRRDRKMAPIIFVAPIVQLIILGYAASVDVKEINTVILDKDKTQESREYADSFFNNGYFQRVGEISRESELDVLMDRGKADIAIILPEGFGRTIARGGSTTAQLIVNGADTNAASVGLNYALQINGRYSSKIMFERLERIGLSEAPFIEPKERVWYNPELKSRYYMVPAILSLLLMIITMMLTAMALVREKEMGTMEQLIVTPIKSRQIIAGKIIPFTIIGYIEATIAVAVAVFWFKAPFLGSLATLFLGCGLFLLNTLGIGLFISTVSNTQQQAMMSVMFFVMFPFIYLSGFIFPIENMPEAAQYATYAIPLRYFLEIVRGVFLKGVGLEVLWPQATALLISGTAIIALSIARFRKTL